MKPNHPDEESRSYLPHAGISPRIAISTVMAGIGITLPAVYICALALPAPPDMTAAAEGRRALQLAHGPGLLAVKALIIYPILEECFYRGLIQQTLRRYLPLWLAVLIPTMIFAISHVGAGRHNVLFAFIVGWFFAWLALRTRSLYAPVLCHAAINLIAIFGIRPLLTAHGIISPSDMWQSLPLALLAGSVTLLVAGYRILRREFARGGAPVQPELAMTTR